MIYIVFYAIIIYILLHHTGRSVIKDRDMKNSKSLLITAVETTAVAAFSFLICFFDIFGNYDTLLTDSLYQYKRGINNRIKIVGIDDRALREFGPMGTWSRQVYADVINTLDGHASVITFDLMITGNMDEQGDEALYEACKRATVPVVAGSHINFNTVYHYTDSGVIYIDNYNVEAVDQPIMADVCETGFVNTFPDSDGVIRSVPITYNCNGETAESLAYKTYEQYCKVNDITMNEPVLDGGQMNISFSGRPGDFEKISLSSILNGEVDPKVLNGCIVFVGAYATGLYDQYAVPASSDIMFGTEIHANVLQSLMDGKFPVKAHRGMVSTLSALVAALLFLMFKRSQLYISIPLSVMTAVLYIFLGTQLNNKGIMIPVLYYPLFALTVIVLGIVHHYISEYAEKKKISEVFRKYVAPQVVDEITGKGGYSIRLGGESRDIAVLFVDIRGFTPMSENLEPEQVVDILNSYLELTTNSIFNNGGTLDKFIGDATMAVFNAPFDLDDYVFRACKTALDIVAGGDAIESKFLEKYGRSVGFGVGVNCGKAVVGNIGCSFRMDYTAIGDTVNTAARLEANAKRGQVLISEEVYKQVKDRVTVEPIGTIPLKGKSKDVFVYSLTGVKEEDTKADETEKSDDNPEQPADNT